MTKNPLVWGTAQSQMEAYCLFSEDGALVPDELSREVVLRQSIASKRFFHMNDLFVNPPLDDDGEVRDVEFRLEDFTEDGIELIRTAFDKWINSKGARKEPPDMRILERALATIRGRR